MSAPLDKRFVVTKLGKYDYILASPKRYDTLEAAHKAADRVKSDALVFIDYAYCWTKQAIAKRNARRFS